MSFQPTPSAPRRPQRGVSLIESLCVVSVLATAVGLSVPALDDWKSDHALRSAAAELETDLQFARSEAVAGRGTVRFAVAVSDGGACYVMHRGGECSCSAGGHAQCSGDAEVLRHVPLPADGPVLYTGRPLSITFDGDRGTVTPTATLKLASRSGRAIHQVVNIMGRVRTCSPGGAWAGLRRC